MRMIPIGNPDDLRMVIAAPGVENKRITRFVAHPDGRYADIYTEDEMLYGVMDRGYLLLTKGYE